MAEHDPSEILARLWNNGSPEPLSDDADEIPEEIQHAVKRSVNVGTKTYRYAALTQLLAKYCIPGVDARAIQEQADLEGSFDARTFCKRHVVPFDRQNDNVLGGSGDPYVNNPLRIPAINVSALPAQRNRPGFQDLIDILDYAERFPGHVKSLLLLYLEGVRERLADTKITYAVPNRIAVESALSVVQDYLRARTGGRRFQSLAAAMFDVIGNRFGLYHEVQVGHINRSDAAAGDVADLNCVDEAGKSVLVVEVKDRKLKISEVQDKLPAVREAGVPEVLFLIRGGIEEGASEPIRDLQRREFSSGHNLYITEFDSFLEVLSILLSEHGRRDLFIRIGERIDEFGELSDRQAWRDLLQNAL